MENDWWVPTFTNARYLFGADEFEFWRARGDDERFGAVFSDPAAPVFDAGLVDLIATDHQVAPACAWCRPRATPPAMSAC